MPDRKSGALILVTFSKAVMESPVRRRQDGVRSSTYTLALNAPTVKIVTGFPTAPHNLSINSIVVKIEGIPFIYMEFPLNR